MSVAARLSNWLNKLSPDNAARPDVKPAPYKTDDAPLDESQPIEIFIDQEVVTGTCLTLKTRNELYRTKDGTLIRIRRKESIHCGACGHTASKLHAEEDPKKTIRGAEGVCFYCWQKLQQKVKKGELLPEEAERQALVCTDCARITAEGNLSCPTHYDEKEDEKGRRVYIGPEVQEELKRQKAVQTILTPFASLLCDNDKPAALPDGGQNE